MAFACARVLLVCFTGAVAGAWMGAVFVNWERDRADRVVHTADVLFVMGETEDK